MAKVVKLSQKAAEQLLTRLATDDAFRDLFKKKPAQALAAVGAPAEAIDCTKGVRRLASKERIRAAHDEIKRTLTEPLAMTVFKLDSYHRG